jgi:putative NADH-flavin reductase
MGPSELAARSREYAAKCVAMAQERDGTDKLSMLDMAQAWLDLAEQALRNERFQVVYETPEA